MDNIVKKGDGGKNLIDKELEEIRRRKLRELLERRNYLDAPVHINEGNFDEFVRKYPIVIIDCYADWCAPCKIVEPIIEESAKNFSGKIVFGKLNVDENRGIATRFNIMSIPTLLIFKDGRLMKRVIGALPKDKLISVFNELII